MKIRNILLAAIVAIAAVSCREEADYTENPSSLLANQQASTFTAQFQLIWNAVNTGYNFWDVSYIDWDQRYTEFKPKFETLDENFVRQMNAIDEDNDSIAQNCLDSLVKHYTDTLTTYYTKLTSGLKDHHMVIYALNPYTQPDSSTQTVATMRAKGIAFAVRPSQEEVNSRSYMHLVDGQPQSAPDAVGTYNALREQYEKDPRVIELDSAYFDSTVSNGSAGYYIYALFQLENGKQVPYLWSGNFSGINSVISYYKNNSGSTNAAITKKVDMAKKFLSIYFGKYVKNITTLDKNKMAGAIIDVRQNGGGRANDLPFIIGEFQGGPHCYWESRFKEGMGRYEMSAWVPDTFSIASDDLIEDFNDIEECKELTTLHRDFEAENIPVVCLTDLFSVSCSEMTAGSIKCMPTGYVIGERTWGGHGALYNSETAYNANYCGVLGDQKLQRYNFFLYTSNFEGRLIGQSVLEGIGISPDQEVLYNNVGFKGQSDAALEYLGTK